MKIAGPLDSRCGTCPMRSRSARKILRRALPRASQSGAVRIPTRIHAMSYRPNIRRCCIACQDSTQSVPGPVSFKSSETLVIQQAFSLTLLKYVSALSFNIDDVIAGQSRLNQAQALEIYHRASLHDLGQWAHAVTQRMHPADYRTYVIDRNINYTNVCTAKCTFCAFRRDHEDADAYTLDYDKIGEKLKELVSIRGTQILMQGGMNDALPIEWYEGLLRHIKTNFPTVHIHAFSPPEFIDVERFFNMDVRQVIRRFKASGLDTIPCGGGE